MITRFFLIAGACLLLAGSLPAMTVATDHPGSLPVLLGLDKVRTELHITSLQRAVLDSLREEYKTEARKLFTPLPQTAVERAAAQEKLAKLNQRYNARALSVLNKSQRTKLAQIECRALGALSIYTPNVQKKLNLSDAQKTQIEKLRQKGLTAVGKINRKYAEGKIGYPERMKLLHDRKEAQSAALLGVLTPGQRTQLASLSGKSA